eukprot:TRINITY_DN14084_c0_g1_i1.p1 TRINITY_DN14084_c0_g1~~TRINITY_DN14084_c0_g1_i1.p1  ORF type:complete len:264 (+),score=73.23 TRINITY_DN14084_c0_g1_i1:81-872(+)
MSLYTEEQPSAASLDQYETIIGEVRKALDLLQVKLARLRSPAKEVDKQKERHAAHVLARHAHSVLQKLQPGSRAVHFLMQRYTELTNQLESEFPSPRMERATSLDALDDFAGDAAPALELSDHDLRQITTVQTDDAERRRDLMKQLQELNELKELALELNATVAQYQRDIDVIAANTAHAEHNTASGATQLFKAWQLKNVLRAVVFPLAGGLVGGLVAGPVGAVAGAKGAILLAATVGGVAVGGAAGQGISVLAAMESKPKSS